MKAILRESECWGFVHINLTLYLHAAGYYKRTGNKVTLECFYGFEKSRDRL